MALFKLISDLDQKIWKDSDKAPPADKKKMAGGTYAPWGIVKVSQENNYYRYHLNSNTGAPPSEGLLYGACRNPLKDVGHCWMTFAEKEPGNVITGLAIEDDWVVMLPEFLASFGEKKKEDAVPHVLVRSETIDMGIYCDLVHDKWDKKGKPPRGKGKLGYHFHEVLRHKDVGNNTYEIGLGDDHGNSIMVKITCTRGNPFHAITKGYFKIVDGIIKGVMVDDDWVEMYE